MWQNLFSKSISIVLLLIPVVGGAQTVHQDFQERVKAEVLEVVAETEREVTGTDAVVVVQDVRVVLLEGQKVGEVVRFDSEQVNLEVGDRIYVNRMVSIHGDEFIMYADFERRGVLAIIGVLFVFMLLVFSGWQGVRALVSLGGSVAAIFFILVPALLAGWNPVITSVGISAVILSLVLFGTHGIKARSVIAFFGTFAAVSLTGIIALVASDYMRLTGLSSDASVYLNFATKGTLDLAGLLLGSIIIGILGVLDDVSITQASVVEQLKRANPTFHFLELYKRAIAVGRDHIGSLVNTLALAYVGVSLPLILLYAKAESSLWHTLNQEVVAAELLRIIVGSIGLILAVPATTAVAAWYFRDRILDEVDGVPPDDAHHHH